MVISRAPRCKVQAERGTELLVLNNDDPRPECTETGCQASGAPTHELSSAKDGRSRWMLCTMVRWPTPCWRLPTSTRKANALCAHDVVTTSMKEVAHERHGERARLNGEPYQLSRDWARLVVHGVWRARPVRLERGP
eukprot:2220966-Prymnesium_polylepis.1